MFKNPLKNTRLAALGATVAGIALAVTGVIEVTDTQSAANATVGIEHVSLGAFSLALLALALPITYVGRLAGARRAATIAIVGQVLLALLCVTSNINGKDLGIFPAVAAPTNLMLFGGWAAIAIALRRRAGLSRALAVSLPASWIAALVLAAVGGGLVAGAYWMAVGYLMASDSLPIQSPSAPEPARA
jgi:hypothetical protein